MTRNEYLHAREYERDARHWSPDRGPLSTLAEAVDLLREALATARGYGRHPDYDFGWYQDDLDNIDAALALTAPKEDSDD